MPVVPSEIQKKFGENLKRIRILKGMSQLDLAAITGLEKPNISAIENGRGNTTIRTACILANGLSIEFRSLFDFD